MGSPKVTYSTVTSVLKVSDYGDGKVEIAEIPSDEASFPGLHSGNRKQIELPLPIPALAVVGYYDIDDKEIGLYVTALGTQVGSKYTASVDRGIDIEINLLIASGSIGVFKEGNKLRGRYRLSAGVWPFKTDYNNDFDLFDL
ncbi:hypothetical protein N7G274_008765 [Stereocaulon virgatum]|uniref:Uncharacterized protein n=1 Tax=Stereocaulon virgatum TaxID=373712 RepID=A0ABR3ZZI7_9LECA